MTVTPAGGASSVAVSPVSVELSVFCTDSVMISASPGPTTPSFGVSETVTAACTSGNGAA